MDSLAAVRLPRITIRFCVQCKWNLRAAYYAQELLQTFSTTIGEISLVPATGGTFTITLYYTSTPTSPTRSPTLTKSALTSPSHDKDKTRDDDDILTFISDTVAREPQQRLLSTVIWDRKRDGGFPETKELKNRVRNLIDPQRGLGHVDRALGRDGSGGKEREKEMDKGAIASTGHEGHGRRQTECEECDALAQEQKS